MPKAKEQGKQSYSGSENLSEAARKMRSQDPDERREGAAEMGQVGGKHSHGGHGPAKNEEEASGSDAA